MPKKRLLLFIFIILSIGLMTYQSNKGYFHPLKFLNNALNSLHGIADVVTDSITSPFKRMLLREQENVRLKAKLSKLLEEQREYHEALRENKRLRELLSLKEKEQKFVTAARVISRSADYWSSSLVIDKGTHDMVEKDMTAITHNGLAGKISDVSRSYSSLLLLTDINFSASVRLQESRREGIISGMGYRKCQLKYIPYDEEIKIGDIINTSGLDALFPKGIPVGYVSRVDKKSTGLFQYIEVLPFVDTTKIEEVAIVKR
ncbi:MAG: rod shape-determining protein MreC [Nitrospirota bacterium]|nr:rod shape-determining protein MreC [Nitrospirota bacterium]